MSEEIESTTEYAIWKIFLKSVFWAQGCKVLSTDLEIGNLKYNF